MSTVAREDFFDYVETFLLSEPLLLVKGVIPMRKRALHGISLLLSFALAGCAHANAASASKPWPTHAPEATPYVRVYSEADIPRAEEGEHFESMEDLWRSIYAEFGHFYAKQDELEMFRALPQDEPYSFVPHSARFHLDKTEAMRMARLFSEKEGCTVNVKALHQLVDGLHDWSYITIVTMTPARMFELSEEMDESFMIEQLYAAVDERFDQLIWDGSPLDEETYLEMAYEKVGSFYFNQEQLAAFREMELDLSAAFWVHPTDSAGWVTETEAIEQGQAFAEAGGCGFTVKSPAFDSVSYLIVETAPARLLELAEQMDTPLVAEIVPEEVAERLDYRFVRDHWQIYMDWEAGQNE